MERLEALPPESPERVSLRAELQRTALRRATAGKKRGDAALAFRSGVLAAELARLDGRVPGRIRDPEIELEFLPGEARRIARTTAAGMLRTRALLAAFTEPGSADEFACEEIAGQAVVEELEARRFESAEALARAWLAHGATAGDAVLCVRVLRSNGRYEEAHDLLLALREQSRLPGATVLVAIEEGRLERARGAPEAAIDRLGSALARGSAPAAVLLGRMALLERENGRALALTRPILEDEPVLPGARRVWALGLLPPDGVREHFAPSVPRGAVPSASDPR